MKEWFRGLWETPGGKAVVHFFTHAIVGTAIFILIAIPAVLLNLTVRWLETTSTDPYVTGVLKFVEHVILAGDAFIYIVLLAKAMYKSAKELEL